ncbi:8026_t:CDS:2, partial [Ambispora leptoticha]
NATRWMSIMKMIEWYKNLIPHITQVNGFSGHDILLVEQLDLGLENRLEKNASIIHDPVFEEAVIKILGKQETILTPEEKQKLQPFIVEPNVQQIEVEG